MASPFAVFRRNQKTLLAVLTLLAILSFLFLPPLMQILDKRQANAGVAATTKYEDISIPKLRQLLDTRLRLNRFMAGAVMEAFGFPMEQPFFGPAREEDVVNNLLMARKAEELGIVVTDEAVRDFLRTRLAGRVRDEQVQQIMENCNLSQQQLFEGLRQELLVSSYYTTILGATSRSGMPPAQRWDLYQRLNRRARIEAIGLKVADFVKDVADPDDRTLAAFFDKHKADYWEPGSSEPGFHRPKRAQFEYLKAERNAFFKPEAISQADVETHYEKFKDTRYLYSGAETEPEQEPADQEPAADAPPGDTPPAQQPMGDTPPAETTPAADAPMTDAPAAETPAAETPMSEAPATDAPAENPSADSPASPPAEPAADAPPGGGGDDAAAAPAESTPTDSTAAPAAETPPADTPAAGTPPATEAAVPAAVTDVPAATPATEVGSDLTLPTDADAGPDPKYDPLWKVEDRIRRELAGQRANLAMQEALRKLQTELNNYSTLRSQATADQPGEEPPRPDFSQLAAAHGLVAIKTDLISQTEALLTLDIARSAVAGGDPFVRFAYEGGMRTFLPMLSEDNEGNQYLFWKTDEHADFVPKLTDEGVRGEVQAAWKTVQARDLAQKKAQELLAKARDSQGLNLRERFAPDGLEVVEAGPFSWLTYGSVEPFAPQTPPRLSAVPGLDQVGPEFMRQVFQLKPGESTVVMNNPRTVVYLARLVGLEPSDDVLHATFLADNPARYQRAGDDDIRGIQERWFEQLGEEAGLDWTLTSNQEAVEE